MIGLGGAGTVCHMGGRSRLPMWLVVGCFAHPCHPAALWIPAYAGMTVSGCFVLLSPSPLIPLPSRERGIGGLGCLVVTPPCGYCLEASMTATLPCSSGLRIKSAMTGTTRRFRIRSGMTGWGREQGDVSFMFGHGHVMVL